ncbi:2524_t:CDS:2, partial [Acaulospora morrowiae]
ICEYNARVAAKHNRPDLEQAWHLASLILSNRIRNYADACLLELIPTLWVKSRSLDKKRKNDVDHEPFREEIWDMPDALNWGRHPLGSDLARDLLQHFINLGDFQMVAMLSCVFREPFHIEPYQINTTGLPLSLVGDNAGYSAAYSEKMSGFQTSSSYQSMSTTFGQMNSESYNSSWGTHMHQLDSATSTPSTYYFAHSEGSGAPITVPSSGHSMRHQRRSTFGGGMSKETGFLSSSLSTASSRSPVIGGRFDYYNWSYYDNERNAENEKRPEKNSDIIITTNFDEFDDERKL